MLQAIAQVHDRHTPVFAFLLGLGEVVEVGLQTGIDLVRVFVVDLHELLVVGDDDVLANLTTALEFIDKAGVH